MTLIQDNPQQEPLFTLAPPLASPKPERNKLKPWHWAVLIVGVPILAFLSCVGANTVAHWWIGDTPSAHAAATSTHKPRASAKPKPSKPAYDLAGYRAAITGAEEQAFVSALTSLRRDNRTSDFTAAVSDAPKLIMAADAWLTALRKTNPPPSYRPGKVDYMLAAILGRRAGKVTQSGLQTVNLALLQRGADLASRANWTLSRAADSAPRGS